MICPSCKTANTVKNKTCRVCGYDFSANKPKLADNKDLISKNGETIDSRKKNKLPPWLTAWLVFSVLLYYIGDFVVVKGFMLIGSISILIGGAMFLLFFVISGIRGIMAKNYGIAAVYFIVTVAIIAINIFNYYQIGDFYKSINNAQTAFSEGRNEDLLKYSKAALEAADDVDENVGLAYYWMAVAYYANNDNAQAKVFGAKAIEFDSNLKPLVEELDNLVAKNIKFWNLIEKANLAWQENRTEDIIKYSEEALVEAKEDNVQKAVANYWLGIGYYRGSQFAKAEEAELLAISLNQNEVGPYVTMGAIKLGQNDVAEAKKYAEKALEIDVNYAWAQNLMGAVLLAENKPQEAVKYFEKAVEISPNTAVFKNNLDDARSR